MVLWGKLKYIINVNCNYSNDNCFLRSSTFNSVSFTKDSSFGAVWSADGYANSIPSFRDKYSSSLFVLLFTFSVFNSSTSSVVLFDAVGSSSANDIPWIFIIISKKPIVIS